MASLMRPSPQKQNTAEADPVTQAAPKSPTGPGLNPLMPAGILANLQNNSP
jgi:hypothetical protein